MNTLWIKICGITRAEDALAAAELGASAIGLVFYPKSPRAVSLDQIEDIVGNLSKTVSVVALFVNPRISEVRSVLSTGAIDLLQFHGEESAGFCEQFDCEYMKALGVGGSDDLDSLMASYASAKYILLDSYDPKLKGGTGMTFDWQALSSLSDEQRTRLIVAGGLNPENVAEAVQTIRPFGVDVSSGVEASKGIKDLSKMKSFIEGVRASA